MQKKLGWMALILLGLTGCSAEWSSFNGARASRGSGSTSISNGTIQASWERTLENRLKVQGKLDFKLSNVIVRSYRNRQLLQEQSVTLDDQGRFSADLDDSRFAQELCVEVACFDI